MLDKVLEKYEAVIGLEIHAQLATKTKAYSSDINEYGSMPNTNVSEVSLGHPGTLPKMNEKSIEYAVKLGLACNSKITNAMHFDRKNYFYPDLPKGYQITQDRTPICTEGEIEIRLKDGTTKSIELTRIHLEEDAGKSIHDLDDHNTLVDLNRAGVPLVEIVTEPVIKSSDEAYAYVTEVRKLVRYLNICDGNMEEGSMRCDANISIMPKGSKEFGTRVEVKNMNSISNVKRAIEHEIVRQYDMIEQGIKFNQETRNFNAETGTTKGMRSKEGAHDYRFFPEPDLQPIFVSEEYIKEVKSNLPPLPNDLFKKYINEYKLSEYDAKILTDTKGVALYFEELTSLTSNYKSAANWLMGDIKGYLNQTAMEIEDFSINPTVIAELIKLVDEGLINKNVANKKVFPELLKNEGLTALKVAENLDLLSKGEDNTKEIITAVKAAMEKFPDKVEAYKNGNKKLLGLFMGEVMKATKGKADPKSANKIVMKTLES